MNIDDAFDAVQRRPQLIRRGRATERGISAAAKEGSLLRIARGAYVDAADWRAEYGEGRHLIQIAAAAGILRTEHATTSHISAGALHDLPLFRADLRRVHVSGARLSGRVDRGDPFVARHRIVVRPGDVLLVGGLPCTSLPRTIADIIRSSSLETAIAAADAAFRVVAWDDRARTYDEPAAEAFREEVRRRLPAGGRGVRQGRFIFDLADGRAELPGESVSRLYLVLIGYAPPRLQVPVRGPRGRAFAVDLELEDVRTFAEFDGRGKYLDPTMRGARDLETVLLEEKQREDWIRGTTGRRLVRWGMEHISSVETLRRRLREFRVPPPP